MKKLIVSTLLLAALITHAGIAGFLTKKAQNWEFIQTVGGMKISQKENALIVTCDVSGCQKVTVEPTTVNSAKGVRRIQHKMVGKKIQITLVTSVLEKGISTTPKPVDLSKYPVGEYAVEYLNPDKTTKPLGKITIAPKKKKLK